MCLPLLLPLTAAAQNVTALGLNPTLVYGGDRSIATVRLNRVASAGGFTVSLSSSQSYAKVPTNVIVPAGKQNATFEVTTSPVTANAFANITAQGGGSSVTSTLSIKVPILQSLSFSPSRIAGGNDATGTLTLTQVTAVAMTCALKSDSTLVKVPPPSPSPPGATRRPSPSHPAAPASP